MKSFPIQQMVSACRIRNAIRQETTEDRQEIRHTRDRQRRLRNADGKKLLLRNASNATQDKERSLHREMRRGKSAVD